MDQGIENSKRHKETITLQQIADTANKKYNTLVQVETVCQQIKDGKGLDPPRYSCGRKSKFSPKVEEALKKAFVLYIQLRNVKRNV